MILKSLEPDADDKEFQFLYPKYDGQSLPNVISTAMQTLGVDNGKTPIKKELYNDHVDLDGINKVVVAALDGFGYRLWTDSGKDKGFFARIAKDGLLMPITSVFPSTTAAAITTINTGLTPLEHGLPEWVLYMREIGMIINTLPFSAYMSEKYTSLVDLGVDSRILYDGRTIYEKLSEEDVTSHTITARGISESAYTRLIKRGSISSPFIRPSDAVIKLRHILESERGRTYVNIYMDDIDATTHNYGPFTEESRGEIDSISNIFKTQLLDKIGKKAAKETLVIVTADHGHTSVDPSKTAFMNDDKKLEGFLASDKGSKILPTGSPRGVFLHINKEDIDEAHWHLSEKFKGVAKVVKSKDAIEQGLFGTGKTHKKFLERAGDLLILPKDHEAIWYEHIRGRKPHYLGVHGGLSKNEMLIPLGMARLSDII